MNYIEVLKCHRFDSNAEIPEIMHALQRHPGCHPVGPGPSIPRNARLVSSSL